MGLAAQVHVVQTPPTASLPRRATRLLEVVAQTAGGDDGDLHFVGHSSGGLDVRLLVAPGTSLPTAFGLEPYAQRVKTVVTVSTPHRGTPIAGFFTSLLGQRLLKVLSLSTIYLLRAGRFPLSVLTKLGKIFARLDDPFAFNNSLVDELFAELLGDFTAERQSAISSYLADVGSDQALMLQLAPAGMDVFNASMHDRPGVRLGSVVTRARPPSLGSRLAAGLNPSAQATQTLYEVLYRINASMPADKLGSLTEAQRQSLVDAYGKVPDPSDNDGVVPTLSQPWGAIIHCANADHLDAIGHYDDKDATPPHFDWLSTGTGFGGRDFEALWTAVARFICAESVAPPVAL